MAIASPLRNPRRLGLLQVELLHRLRRPSGEDEIRRRDGVTVVVLVVRHDGLLDGAQLQEARARRRAEAEGAVGQASRPHQPLGGIRIAPSRAHLAVQHAVLDDRARECAYSIGRRAGAGTGCWRRAPGARVRGGEERRVEDGRDRDRIPSDAVARIGGHGDDGALRPAYATADLSVVGGDRRGVR